MKYTDFLSITLTALAVILAALGIGLAITGIFGYRAIIGLAADRAEKAALRRIEEFFKESETTAMLKGFVVEKLDAQAVSAPKPDLLTAEGIRKAFEQALRPYPKEGPEE